MGRESDGSPPRLEWEEREVDTPLGLKRVLIVTPAQAIHLGASRLGRIQEGDNHSPVDDEIVRRVAESPNELHAVLFRAWGGSDDRSWGFAKGLTDEDIDELGYEMVRSALLLAHRLMHHEVYAVVCTEFGWREFDAFRDGTKKLRAEMRDALPKASGGIEALLKLDLWLLRHLALWTASPLDEFVYQGLPETFALIERHLADMVAMLEAVPSDLLERSVSVELPD